MKTECAVNLLQISLFERIATDIPDSKIWEPGSGHGHSPVWILGHMAITGELGQRMLGGRVTHAGWIRHFGPGSQDPINAESTDFNKAGLVGAVLDAYDGLRRLYDGAPLDVIEKAHGIALFEGSAIQTIGHAVAHLLTSHFGFHLAQLSSVRRSAGHPRLI